MDPLEKKSGWGSALLS